LVNGNVTAFAWLQRVMQQHPDANRRCSAIRTSARRAFMRTARLHAHGAPWCGRRDFMRSECYCRRAFGKTRHMDW